MQLSITPSRRRAIIGLLYAGLLVWAIAVAATAMFNKRMGWDFRVYYAAAQAYSQDRDPYDRKVISDVSNGEATMSFVYPPLVLPLLLPLTLVSKSVAFIAYTCAKFASVILFIWIWARVVLPDKRWHPVLFLVCAFGFRETINRDLYAGNVAIFEQLALWCGIAALLRGRYLLYALAIAAASLCKPPLIIFLGLALFAEDRRKAMTAAAGVFLLFCLMHAASMNAQHDLYLSFLDNVSVLDERGGVNPASLAMIRDITESLVSKESAIWLANTIWGLFAAAVIAAALVMYRKVRHVSLLDAICAFILIFAILSPRMKNYSYIICIVPAVRVISLAASPWVCLGLLGFACISFFPYQPLFVSMALIAVLALTVWHKAGTMGSDSTGYSSTQLQI